MKQVLQNRHLCQNYCIINIYIPRTTLGGISEVQASDFQFTRGEGMKKLESEYRPKDTLGSFSACPQSKLKSSSIKSCIN